MKYILTTVLLLAASMARAQVVADAPLPPPPQDKGLPYTRSAGKPALEKIKDGIAVYPGSRYGYVKGYRVRLSDTDLLRGEAVEKDGVVYVPGSFAALVGLKKIHPKPVPQDLAPIADRWVYAPGELMANPAQGKVEFKATPGVAALPVRGETYYSLQDVARAKGLQVAHISNGVLFVGDQAPVIGEKETALRDSIVTLFDTPDKLADPDIATRSIPSLKRQGKWTDHVKVTPEQLAVLNGPETDWPTPPKSEYDSTGLNEKLLGSKVPPPGVYPRVLFSPEDVPMLGARVKSTVIGQKSLIEMEYLFRQSWWDPKSSDGQVFQKLSTGDLASLDWDAPPGTTLNSYPQTFKGQKPGIHNSHVAYVPECLTAMALYCLITGDDVHGRQAAAAIANYFKLREKLLDEWLTISDSEFGSSYIRADGSVVNLNGAGAKTHWRNIHGVVPNMNLGLSLDFAGKWMTPTEKDLMRRIIAKATYGRRSYAQDAPVRFRDVNWMAWDLPHFLAVASIEGLSGFDPEAYASGAESVRAFCDWGIDDSGVVYESNGKTPGSFQFHLLSMIALARRGDNLFGHPHWRKLLEGQVQMTSPNGRVTVNSGTQYVPYSRQSFSLTLVNEIKGFFPGKRLADYLITKAVNVPGAATDEYLRNWPAKDFNPEAYRKEVAGLKRLRLPSVTYPGFVNGVLYDGDYQPATRADLIDLPLDFNAPVHGVFSSYSDRTPDAAWINMLVRPDHYLGAGHHHADSGMFHFSALGVDWFTQSPFSGAYDGKYFNLVQVDGESEPTNVPSSRILGYNGAAKYIGAVTGDHAAAASADLTYAYSWRWLTQPPQVWSDELNAMGWEMDPSPGIQRIFAGTARYKMRPWWTNYTYSNYIPTSRAPFNPMRYVFRTTGLVRGAHPYGFVVDDLKKDDSPHLYQWAAMLNGGVWRAEVPGLAANQVALAFREPDPKADPSVTKLAIKPERGEPLLIVCAVGMDASGKDGLPLLQVETARGPADKKGVPAPFDRLLINRQAADAGFKVLLIPHRAGEPLPKIALKTSSYQELEVTWPDQADVLKFTSDMDFRSRVTFKRGTETLDAP
jgi:hypothetical protein